MVLVAAPPPPTRKTYNDIIPFFLWRAGRQSPPRCDLWEDGELGYPPHPRGFRPGVSFSTQTSNAAGRSLFWAKPLPSQIALNIGIPTSKFCASLLPSVCLKQTVVFFCRLFPCPVDRVSFYSSTGMPAAPTKSARTGWWFQFGVRLEAAP